MVREPSPKHASVRSLVDLSFCLALIGSRDERLKAAVLGYAPGELAISAVTAAALHLRAARSSNPARNRLALAQFLLPLAVAEFGADAATMLAGFERGDLAGAATSSEAIMVAAQAVALDASVLTCAPILYRGLSGVRLHAIDSARGDAAEGLSGFSPLNAAQPHGLILAMGSHDLTFDLVGERLHRQRPELLFCTSHVGSMDGLLALRRGEAHLAGVHLLDAETGVYNIPQVRRVLGDEGCHGVIVGFVQRIQGLIVARGNPKEHPHDRRSGPRRRALRQSPARGGDARAA